MKSIFIIYISLAAAVPSIAQDSLKKPKLVPALKTAAKVAGQVIIGVATDANPLLEIGKGIFKSTPIAEDPPFRYDKPFRQEPKGPKRNEPMPEPHGKKFPPSTKVDLKSDSKKVTEEDK